MALIWVLISSQVRPGMLITTLMQDTLKLFLLVKQTMTLQLIVAVSAKQVTYLIQTGLLYRARPSMMTAQQLFMSIKNHFQMTIETRVPMQLRVLAMK